MMHRRDFIRGAAYLGSALAVGVTVPAALIGGEGTPGGFYAPIPDDLSRYVRWLQPTQPFNMDVMVQRGLLSAIWAPLGSSHGAVAQFVTVDVLDRGERAMAILQSDESAAVLTSSLLAAKRDNALRSLRAFLESSHEPGWIKVSKSYDTGRTDESGDAVWASRAVWVRCGYLAWMTPDGLASIGRDIVVAA